MSKKYEVRIEYQYGIVVSVEADFPGEAVKIAKQLAIENIDVSYDDTKIDDMSMPCVIDSLVYEVD